MLIRRATRLRVEGYILSSILAFMLKVDAGLWGIKQMFDLKRLFELGWSYESR
jgi:hypothetical protein